MSRIYKILGVINQSVNLVRAGSESQAIRHVSRSVFTACVATQDDLVELISTGVEVETAGERQGEAEEPALESKPEDPAFHVEQRAEEPAPLPAAELLVEGGAYPINSSDVIGRMLRASGSQRKRR